MDPELAEMLKDPSLVDYTPEEWRAVLEQQCEYWLHMPLDDFLAWLDRGEEMPDTGPVTHMMVLVGAAG